MIIKTKKSDRKRRSKVTLGIVVMMLSLLFLCACGKDEDNRKEQDNQLSANTESEASTEEDSTSVKEDDGETGDNTQGQEMPEDEDSKDTQSSQNNSQDKDATSSETDEDREQNSGNSEGSGNFENAGNTGNAGSSENTDNSGDTENSGNSGTAGNVGGSGNGGNSGNSGATGNTGDSGNAGNAGNSGTTGDSGNKEDSETTPATKEYVVNVFSEGGHKLYNVKVNVYADKTMKELVETAATNRNGKATINLVPSKDYVFTLSNVPTGYQLSSSYSFSGRNALVVLNSSLVAEEDVAGTRLKAGDVMYDFTVSSAKGGEITLSDVLKNKKMVMLNFWYVNCEFCVKEFPFMSSAYNQYKNDVEVIALDPFDTMEDIQTFLGENPLPFQVASCSLSLPETFGVSAYPVSVVIDQYGVIREIEKGAILEDDGFISIFDKYGN